jgi:flagellar basal body-associated protein FliL
MRPVQKHWLLLVFLVVSLAAMVAFAAWHISKARDEAGQYEQPEPLRGLIPAAEPALR